VLRERRPYERRVALVPDALAQLIDAGHEILVETGAGLAAAAPDAAYTAAGAHVVQLDDTLPLADVVLGVAAPEPELVSALKPGTVTLSFLSPATELPTVQASRDAGTSALSLELVPRISRAQAMDALSSQATVAGYRAALAAASLLPRFFPLLMTAAGTIRPAKVLVLGAGVAGLQAIATARRLGAVVSGYDVRAAAAEEIASMGARPVDLGLDSLEGAGGYAREMTAERAALQAERLTPHVRDADVLITTAAVPGRTAPMLVSADMLTGMRPGSVVVDLAAESGGNVEGSVAGETQLLPSGVVLFGARNLPSEMAEHASRLLSTNVVNLLLLVTRDGAVVLDTDDEIVDGALVVHDGQVRHAATAALLAPDAALMTAPDDEPDTGGEAR